MHRYQVIIGCTANAFNDEQRRCLEAGMDGVLIKPVGLTELHRLIQDYEKTRLSMDEIRAMAGEQTHLMVSVVDELVRSSEDERQKLQACDPEKEEQFGAALHRQKGSFALAGFQSGVDLCRQMEKALQVRDIPALRLSQLQLNALSLRFISLLIRQRQRLTEK